MSGKRMLSRRQCVFVIVVMPMLIIPAMLILRIADKPEDEPYFPPRREPAVMKSVTRKLSNESAGIHKIPPKPKPKCFEYIWSGSCRDTCHRFDTRSKQRQRRQVTLKCEKTNTQLKTKYTTKQKYVFKAPFQDSCLRKIVDWYCNDRKLVPNIVHFVWFGKVEFNFIHFLSFLSAHRFQNPCLIMLHADKLPKGPLWLYFLQISPKVIHVQRKQPKKIFRKKLAFVEHKADVAKLEALKEYGGIYLDTDQVLLRSVDKYRNNDATIGLEYGNMAANSVVIAKKNALFVKFWYDKYKSYSKTDGHKHSNEIPYKLSQKYKDFVTVVEDIFSFPNAHQLPMLYSKNVDWRKQYGVHMHLKLHERFYKSNILTMDSIRSMNTTAGAIARFIIYGTSELCTANTVIQ